MSESQTTHPASPEFKAQANVTAELAARWREEAAHDFRQFWANRAREEISWHTPFTQVLDETNPPLYRWFSDGTLNVSYNCLDRQIARGLAHRTALIFESDAGATRQLTYQALLTEVCRFANGLWELGVRTGDRIVIYLPTSLEAVIAMQACARLGAVHVVVFGGFAAVSLRERIIDTGASIVITANESRRGGKVIPLKAIVDEALNDPVVAVRHVIVNRRTAVTPTMKPGRDQWLEELLAHQPTTFEPIWLPADAPLFILHTSGSTGKPKGLVHAAAGYLLAACLGMRTVFDVKPADLMWCTADIGWITGHTFTAYGPLAVGSTALIYEGTPLYPTPHRWWEMIERHRPTLFYTAPTAIRSLMRHGDSPREHDLSSLRLLGTAGEPINPSAWQWYYELVGGSRCPVVDTWWQTETSGPVMSALPGIGQRAPGSCDGPLPGQFPVILDTAGQAVPANTSGQLCFSHPWPSLARTIWGDDRRYKESYWLTTETGPVYTSGDWAQQDETGRYWILGRLDDTLNVSGHKLGTAEIESALATHPNVAEAAVIAQPDDLTGQAIVAYIVPRQESPGLAEELRQRISQQIGAHAKPRDIFFVAELPKTRSGKTMRRLLRASLRGHTSEEDVSTLDNPSAIDGLKA